MSSNRYLKIGYSNTHHDSSIAVEYDGKIFAESIERSTQNKRNFINLGIYYIPKIIKKAIQTLEINPEDIKAIEVFSTWDYGFFRRLHHIIIKAFINLLKFNVYRLSKKTDRYEHMHKIIDYLITSVYGQTSYIKMQKLVPLRISNKVFHYKNPKIKIKKSLHHSNHAAYGIYSSPFNECTILVLDGSGEYYSFGGIYEYRNGKLTKVKSLYAAFGGLYIFMTILCGFDPTEGEEWKVMGLAPYGKFNQELYDFFDQYITIKGTKPKTRYFSIDQYKKLQKIVGQFRSESDPDVMKSADLAYNFQKVFEEKVIQLADNIHKKYSHENLVFVGGCALNSSLNGRLHTETGFKKVHIPSAPGDDGNSIGVLFKEHLKNKSAPPRSDYLSPYLGSPVDIAQLKKILKYKQIKYKLCNEKTLQREIAKELADGKVVAWMQGCAEFGPRALGNRSILADPRRKEMKERINSIVKFRELYRPFAPSILEDYGEEYFEDYYPSYYMERTLKFKKEVQSKVPAVVHVNKTGRLQSVRKDWNPRYYGMIQEFHKMTGVPLVLNTSLNVMGKPIVGSVEDAFTLFYTTGVDVMAIDKYIFYK